MNSTPLMQRKLARVTTQSESFRGPASERAGGAWPRTSAERDRGWRVFEGYRNASRVYQLHAIPAA
jgi:hypothetical protein